MRQHEDGLQSRIRLLHLAARERTGLCLERLCGGTALALLAIGYLCRRNDARHQALLLYPQERTGRYLEHLCAGTTLALSATQPAAGARGKAGGAEIDKITKTVTVRPPAGADGEVRFSSSNPPGAGWVTSTSKKPKAWITDRALRVQQMCRSRWPQDSRLHWRRHGHRSVPLVLLFRPVSFGRCLETLQDRALQIALWQRPRGSPHSQSGGAWGVAAAARHPAWLCLLVSQMSRCENRCRAKPEHRSRSCCRLCPPKRGRNGSRPTGSGWRCNGAGPGAGLCRFLRPSSSDGLLAVYRSLQVGKK